ncbi:helix-turn-helix transcriptional regulator [Neobacillus drentensis]|uniref:helix-turn-helix domain-containing protein n=1 Tax=Neobacillus drentensis TaxID=220684 RepID=UPI003000E9E2
MLGKQIQKLRQEKNLTLSQLAEKTCISKSYLSQIERNIQSNPSIEIVGKIATALDVDIQTLLSQDTPIHDSNNNGRGHVIDWINFINTALESGLINEKDLIELRNALQKGKT